MEFTGILLIAVALSMDSFAVSIANGFYCGQSSIRRISNCAFILALCQGIFPVAGWALGSFFNPYIHEYDHWIAFFILLAIGGKMLVEGLSSKKKDGKCYLSFSAMIFLGFATSIDAFFAGISFAFIEIKILLAAIIIGITTYIFAFAGHYIGSYFGLKFAKTGEVTGGVLIILIGVKILLEHIQM